MGASSVTGVGYGAVKGKVRQYINVRDIVAVTGDPAYDFIDNEVVSRSDLWGGKPYPGDAAGVLQNDGTGNLSWSATGGYPSEIVCRDFTFEEGYEKWDDLRLAGTDLRAGASAPAFTNFRGGLWLQGFVTNQVDEVHFTIQMPHAWKEGTDISPHIHWTHNVLSPGNNAGVVWKMEYSWTNIGDPFPTTNTLEAPLTWTTSPPAQYKHILTPFSADISGTGKKISSQIIGRLYRDTTDDRDTWSGIALLIELDFHYQIDSLGSDELFIK